MFHWRYCMYTHTHLCTGAYQDLRVATRDAGLKQKLKIHNPTLTRIEVHCCLALNECIQSYIKRTKAFNSGLRIESSTMCIGHRPCKAAEAQPTANLVCIQVWPTVHTLTNHTHSGCYLYIPTGEAWIMHEQD